MKRFFWLLILILITSIVFVPALRASFWWVDDGTSILAARKIIDSLTHLNFQGLGFMFDGGRFMIVYWLYHTLEFLLGGYNPTIHFFIHYLLILATSCLIFSTVKVLTKSNFPAFFSGLLYVLVPLNTENLFRLGPQEPILSLFVAASIYFLFRKNNFLSVLFLLLATLTKENGFILWIPFLILYVGKRLLLKKVDVRLFKYSLWGLAFSVPTILNAIFRKSGYSSNYIFDVGQMIVHFRGYIGLVSESFSPFLIIFVATFLVRIIINFRKGKIKKNRLSLLNQGTFLLLFFEFVAIMSPWKYFLGRYLMPSTVGLTIFMGLEISAIKNFFKAQKWKFNRLVIGLFVGYFLFFLSVNAFRAYISGVRVAANTSFIQSLFKYLAETVLPNGIVLYNFLDDENTKEYVVQTGEQLDFLYHRPDIKVDYLKLDKIPKGNLFVVGTSIVQERYSREDVEVVLKGSQKNDHLASEVTYPVLTNPASMVTQVIKKTYALLFKKTPFSGEGIIAYYYSRDYWYTLYAGRKIMLK